METSLMLKPPPPRIIKHIQLFNFISKLIIIAECMRPPSLPSVPSCNFNFIS